MLPNREFDDQVNRKLWRDTMNQVVPKTSRVISVRLSRQEVALIVSMCQERMKQIEGKSQDEFLDLIKLDGSDPRYAGLLGLLHAADVMLDTEGNKDQQDYSLAIR